MVQGKTWAAAALALSLLGGRARAADDTVPIDEHTAAMVGDGRLKLGVLAFEYGLTSWLSVGSDTLAWLAGVVSPVFAPNLHFKAQLLQRERYAVSAQLAGYYANATNDEADGHLFTVPLTLIGSVEVFPRLWMHAELNYNWTRAVGAGDLDKVTINGEAATRSGQLGLMFEYRLTRVVSFLARGRYQAFSRPVVFTGTGDPDPYTRVDVQAQTMPDPEHPWMAVGALALTWSHVGLVIGGGYGSYFVPGANLAVTDSGFVPEGSLWVRF